MKMREATKNDKMKTILSTMSIKKISLKKRSLILCTTFALKNADVFKMSSLATVVSQAIFC